MLIAVTASVDAYFVGKLGLEALAGLSLVFPPMMLMQQMANASMGGAMPAGDSLIAFLPQSHRAAIYRVT